MKFFHRSRVWCHGADLALYLQKIGAIFRQHSIPLPITSKEEFVKTFWAGLTYQTKIIFISQITNLTGFENDTRRVNFAHLGTMIIFQTSSDGTIFFDAFESLSQSDMGPVAMQIDTVLIKVAIKQNLNKLVNGLI